MFVSLGGHMLAYINVGSVGNTGQAHTCAAHRMCADNGMGTRIGRSRKKEQERGKAKDKWQKQRKRKQQQEKAARPREIL
jgi:hypothetical protein